jgi:ribosomal protein S19E (S16A)
MVEDSLLYGVERFTARGEVVLQQIDRELGIDPNIGRQNRHELRCERETLMQLEGRGIVPDHADYMTGMRGLAEKGDIRRKARGKGYVITPQGRRRIKEIDAAVLRHFEKIPTR